MFTYAAAETILGKLYGVPDQAAQRGAFRGRLKHLKRLGIPLGSNPGKGTRVSYEAEHLYQWAFCLELEEFGIDPTVIVRLISNRWPEIFQEFEKAERNKEDFCMVLYPLMLMSAAWRVENRPARGRPHTWVWALESNLVPSFSSVLPPKAGAGFRWLVFDLSRITRAVQAELQKAGSS